jgi:chitin synthase
VAKRNCNWILHYAKDAKAETDVPPTVHEFISQRRRWLNGTFFCQCYAIFHLSRLFSTQHNVWRKLALMLQWTYMGINLLFSWFGIANFYLAFFFLGSQTFSPPGATNQNSSLAGGLIFDFIRLIYFAVIIAQFVCSLGNRPQGSKAIYIGSMLIFAIIMAFMLGLTLTLVYLSWPHNTSWFVNGGTSRDVVLSMLTTYGVYFTSSMIAGEPFHIVSCVLQYMLLLPTSVNTLQIYAFCNSHDVSWGTKGDNKAQAGEAHGHKAADGAKGGDKGKLRIPPSRPPFLSQEQLSLEYRKNLETLGTRPEEHTGNRDMNTKREDYYKSVRTGLVLVWVLTNGLLVSIFTNQSVTTYLTNGGDPGTANPYMTFLMWSVASLSLFRFVGCIAYHIKRFRRQY